METHSPLPTPLSLSAPIIYRLPSSLVVISVRVWALLRLGYIQTACSRVHRPTNLVAQLSMSSLAQLSLWLATFAGVSATGSFIQPPQPGPTGDFSNDPTYKIGSIMSVEWESNLNSMDLRLFQQYPLPDGVWTYTDLERKQRP